MTSETVPAVIVSLIMVLSIVLILIGLANIVMSIYARGEPTESTIYFGSIASCELSQYRESVLARDEDSYREDLISQIHICSVICNKKFKHYKIGLVSSVIGICTLIVASLLALIL